MDDGELDFLSFELIVYVLQNKRKDKKSSSLVSKSTTENTVNQLHKNSFPEPTINIDNCYM